MGAINIELPRLNGLEVNAWIFKVDEFFDFYNTKKIKEQELYHSILWDNGYLVLMVLAKRKKSILKKFSLIFERWIWCFSIRRFR